MVFKDVKNKIFLEIRPSNPKFGCEGGHKKKFSRNKKFERKYLLHIFFNPSGGIHILYPSVDRALLSLSLNPIKNIFQERDCSFPNIKFTLYSL